MNVIWLELAKAGIEAISAGAKVFADRSEDVAKRLEGDLKVALTNDKRDKLKELAGE